MDTVDTTQFVWRIEAGESESLTFPVLDEDDPFDISTWTVDAAIKSKPGGTVLYSFPPSQITKGTTTVTLQLPPSATADWTRTTAWFRVKLIDPASSPTDPTTYRILAGPVVILPD